MEEMCRKRNWGWDMVPSLGSPPSQHLDAFTNPEAPEESFRVFYRGFAL